MQVVINISKDDLDAIKYLKVKGWASRHELLILNGIPLPEGHGRLIDADALVDSLSSSDRDIYCKAVIEEEAPTVIPADKEGNEDEKH